MRLINILRICEVFILCEHFFDTYFPFQPPKKDTKGSSKQPQKTQKKKEGGSGGKAKKKVCIVFPPSVRLMQKNFDDECLYS